MRAGKRWVPLFPAAKAAIGALAIRAHARGRDGADDLIFATEHGTPLHASNFNRRVWAKALQRAGLGEWTIDASGRRNWHGMYRWHDLRHTLVSRCNAAGVDVKTLQALAGHASPTITIKRYTHADEELMAATAVHVDPSQPAEPRRRLTLVA